MSSAGDGGSGGRDNSGEAVATKGEEDNGGNGDKAEEAASTEELVEEKRLLRLKLDEANRKTEKARRGRKAAEKVRASLKGEGRCHLVEERVAQFILDVSFDTVRYVCMSSMYFCVSPKTIRR